MTLPYARAFVVQFTSESDVRLEHEEGRVEHMQSDRRVRFASAVDLLACIARLLADDKSDSTGRPMIGMRGRCPKGPSVEPAS